MSDQEEFLNDASGESHPAIKWDKVGETLVGRVATEPKVVMRPNLNTQVPEPQLVVNLDCTVVPSGEVGLRTLWVGKTGFLGGAISDAAKETTGKAVLAVGGELKVKFTEERDTGKPKPARVFKAVYTAPAASSPNLEDIF